jgi:4'-phosphopantetheinyl transferase
MPARDLIDVWQVQTGPGEDRHAPLRAVLSLYLQHEPVLERGPRGKPGVRGHALQFSFSRSGDVALVAVAPDRPVGVDVEWMKPARPVERIARRMFAADEIDALETLPPPERAAAFHRCWTGKEAYVKALGTGLGHGLGRFSLAGLLADHQSAAVGDWQVVQVPTPAGHAAAVAAPGTGWGVNLRTMRVSDG